jgi:hypothetical protein
MSINIFDNKCAVCPKTSDLKACGGCKLAVYCSKDCQRIHRPDHKRTCDWAIEIAASRFSNITCSHCHGPTLADDYTCPCLSKFCSELCKAASDHVRDGPICQAIRNVIQNHVIQELDSFRIRGGEMSDDEMNRFGHVLYMKALFMDSETDSTPRMKALSRMLLIHAARLMHKSAVARVGNFTNEQLIEALTMSI